MNGTAVLSPPFVATPRQNELALAWYDPALRVVVADGAYRSGKTQGAARLLVEEAMTRPGLYLVARQGYRALWNSTQRAILFGDGSLPPLLPKEAVSSFNRSDNTATLYNGAQLLFQSLEEGASEKLRGLTLAGAFIDQLEELDGGEDGERLYDTILGRLSDPRGLRKLIAASNPGPVTHWAFRRLICDRTRDRGVGVVRFAMRDNPHLPGDYIAGQEATRETRPYYFKSFVLGEWGHFEGAAFEDFSEETHVIDGFPLEASHDRFECMDYGLNNPTAWHLVVADYDGNLIVYDTHYAPGLPSDTAAEVLRKRETSWGAGNTCWADPSVRNRTGSLTRWGAPATIATEFADHGVHLSLANNDRKAGYARLRELIAPDPERLHPDWHPRRHQPGSPRLFVMRRSVELVEQLRSAPIEDQGLLAMEAVAAKYEGSQGHAIAALRYGVMARPGASTVPVSETEDAEQLRAEAAKHMFEKHQQEFVYV